ncbi:MAG: ABC transporter ATP-binding protein [Actinomycetota bacterium]
MKPLLTLLRLLTPRERRRLVLLLLLTIGSALLSVASIAAFGPFMRLVSDPGALGDGITGELYRRLGSPEPRSFLLGAGAGVFLLILLSNVAKVLTLHGIHRFAGMRRYTLSLRLFRQYLFQPYAFHIDRNSAGLSQGLLNEIDKVVNGVLRPAIDAVAQGILVVGILLFLLITSPLIAIAAVGLLSVAYTAVYLFARPRLSRLGRTHWETNGERFSVAGEAFGAIKELKVLAREGRYAERYAGAAREHATAEAWLQTYATVPRYMLEAIAFGLIIALILILVSLRGTMADALPILAVYALAGYRLMPAIQSVYSSVAQARYFAHTVDNLSRDLTGTDLAAEEPDSPAHDAARSAAAAAPDATPTFHTLRLSGVSFSYPGSDIPVIRDVSLELHRNETIAFVGTTGCGKTTLVDIILGLLAPTSGTVTVNDAPAEPRRQIAAMFGYVPQSIFLADATVTENIALGIAPNQIDHTAVERAARTANLHEFVTTELAAGYATVVGERGVRLSGGQRQRIGIARALYHNPDLLVLDEATNALDTVTETAVMQAVADLHHRKTLILIAHRLTSLHHCDRIYLLHHGHITATGTYDHLLATSPRFRALAGAHPAPADVISNQR